MSKIEGGNQLGAAIVFVDAHGRGDHCPALLYSRTWR
jgi:hypothetical protein